MNKKIEKQKISFQDFSLLKDLQICCENEDIEQFENEFEKIKKFNHFNEVFIFSHLLNISIKKDKLLFFKFLINKNEFKRYFNQNSVNKKINDCLPENQQAKTKIKYRRKNDNTNAIVKASI